MRIKQDFYYKNALPTILDFIEYVRANGLIFLCILAAYIYIHVPLHLGQLIVTSSESHGDKFTWKRHKMVSKTHTRTANLGNLGLG